jgi:hypothetical protein
VHVDHIEEIEPKIANPFAKDSRQVVNADASVRMACRGTATTFFSRVWRHEVRIPWNKHSSETRVELVRWTYTVHQESERVLCDHTVLHVKGRRETR